MVVAATGFFDGVHLGHRKVIDQVCAVAKEEGKRSAIITFWPHPRNILQHDADKLRLLTSLEEKRQLCSAIGVDDFFVIPFSRPFSELSLEEFVKEYLQKQFNVSTLILGHDHRLGHDLTLSLDQMMEVIASCGVKPIRVGEFTSEEVVVSSTVIRNLLFKGDVSRANELLCYDYPLTGVVVSGNRIGRTYGFPTANLQLYEPLKVVPANGVYFVRVQLLGRYYKGICNIGHRPTMGDERGVTIETHILDFNEDIYGLDMTISFISRMRDERRFPSVDALKEQLICDKETAASYAI